MRVFAGEEITPEVLMASACLPSVFQAVEMDDPATGQRVTQYSPGATPYARIEPNYQQSA